MTVYKGSVTQSELSQGSNAFAEAYKGSQLIYQSSLPSGTVIFESSTPGTYTINITSEQTYYIDLVGSGGMGSRHPAKGIDRRGGSAAYIHGNIQIAPGSYTLVVAASSANASSFLNNVANGGGNATPLNHGNGGTANVVSSGLIGENGSNGSTIGWINNYGAGGKGKNVPGTSGYCKIVVA